MREVFYNADITDKAINEIKLLSLYYDKIVVVNDAVYSPKFETVDGKFQFAGVEDIQFIPKTFNDDYKILIDENIIETTKKEKAPEDDRLEQQFAKRISEVVNSAQTLIFPNHPTEEDGKVITEEVYNVMKHMFDYEWGKPVEVNCVWWYYSLKLKWYLKLLLQGKKCVTNSNNLNMLCSNFINSVAGEVNDFKFTGYRKSLAIDAIKISLPNPDSLTFEDILEIKYRLKDELALFSQAIQSIEIKSQQSLIVEMSEEEYNSLLFTEIQKPLIELRNKLKNLNSRTFRKFIEKLQNPKTYVPLVGSVIASLPLNYTLLASLGITTGLSYLEFAEEKREIKSNGLYFLLKIN